MNATHDITDRIMSVTFFINISSNCNIKNLQSTLFKTLVVKTFSSVKYMVSCFSIKIFLQNCNFSFHSLTIFFKKLHLRCVASSEYASNKTNQTIQRTMGQLKCRGLARTPQTSQMESFVTKVNSFQWLAAVAKLSVLEVYRCIQKFTDVITPRKLYQRWFSMQIRAKRTGAELNHNLHIPYSITLRLRGYL